MTGTLTVNGLIINHWPPATCSRTAGRFTGITTLAYLSAAEVQGTPEELAAIERELAT